MAKIATNYMTRSKSNGPIDTVINYIQNEITKKNVLPGDKLPSERKLSELLGVGRPHIRAASLKTRLHLLRYTALPSRLGATKATLPDPPESTVVRTSGWL